MYQSEKSMYQLGIDAGTSTIKLVVMKKEEICFSWQAVHQSQPVICLKKGLDVLLKQLGDGCKIAVGITGSYSGLFRQTLKAATMVEDIPAIVEGVRYLVPQAGSVIEIGSQSSRFMTHLQGVPAFSANEHCAGGTGSFFEDQMSRLGMKIEDYSEIAAQAASIPRLSGRCAVFAKTDIIHRQQEGVSIPDILLGLCYAMVKNYKATIVGKLLLEKPVVFCGGVTKNAGVRQAVKEVFQLDENELIIPEHAEMAAAAGAARCAKGSFDLKNLLKTIGEHEEGMHCQRMAPLHLQEGIILGEPKATGVFSREGCALGIDIGSTSTDLVLMDREGKLVDYQYLRTAGNPEMAVRKGLAAIKEKFGEAAFCAVGVTGSGRERIGRMIGADVIKDEITAQAAGAAFSVPDVDTIFEIGGQDSKFISLKEGEVVDFQMNKICAAGTGSFIEEQAARMGIPISDFGLMALKAQAPVDLGERCTVFIETAIAGAASAGVDRQDIAAGLCYAIVRNYLHKVVGSKHIGEKIVLQGGVNYNPGIVAAFQTVYGKNITVNPYFSISGAMGAALLAMEETGDAGSHFRGFDGTEGGLADEVLSAEIHKNIEFYRQANQLLLDGYTGIRNPKKKTVGVPFALMIHKFFPMANAFFTSLGFNVVLTKPTSEETIRLSQESAGGETCYPVKLIYGHMRQLIDQKVDYIFLPTIHTMKHETSRVEHNYGCVYMQTAPASVAKALDLESYGITLLSPVFDLDFGKEAMATAMLGLGKILGISKPFCAKALMAGAMAVRKHTKAVEKQGEILMSSLKPEDKVLVLITRNYGISDPILNMGIPEKLLERGYKVITLSHLPAHDLDISEEHPNLYWPFGQHILSGAKLVANHPNLYAVYLTNHGCGPDTMISHLFKAEMGDKPYLQIEVDEHFSPVGVITRIEAFLNSLKHRETVKLDKNYNWQNVPVKRVELLMKPATGKKLMLPYLGVYSHYMQQYFQAKGIATEEMAEPDDSVFALGRSYTNSKEYLSFVILAGSVLKECNMQKNAVQFLIPETLGAEADGQYARVIRSLMDRKGFENHQLVTPKMEKLYETAEDLDLLIRVLAASDLTYLIPEEFAVLENTAAENIAEELSKSRKRILWAEIPTWEQLEAMAGKIGAIPVRGRRIAAVGEMMSLTVLDEGILDKLTKEGDTVLRVPMTEMLLFMWLENGMEASEVRKYAEKLQVLGQKLRAYNMYSGYFEQLTEIADQYLPQFAGGNGRYRYAKAIQMGETMDAVLSMAPRYENTAMVLEMRELKQHCQAPLYEISLDHDWDESAWSRLKSFLYYC